MLLIVGAVVVGIGVGLSLGGSLRSLSDTHFRWWGLALLGLAVQVVPVPDMGGRADDWIDSGLLVASYLSLLTFLVLSIRLPGFPLVALGIGLNALVIAINGGMPVSDHALRAAYGAGYQDIREVLIESGPPKHHLADPSRDALLPLADVIAVGEPVKNVFSVGDLVSMAGIVWVLAAATKGAPGKHRAGSPRVRSKRSAPRTMDELVRAREPSKEGIEEASVGQASAATSDGAGSSSGVPLRPG